MINKSLKYKIVVSINKLIDNMFIEQEKTFNLIVHDLDWVIYHDALTLFILKTINGIYARKRQPLTFHLTTTWIQCTNQWLKKIYKQNGLDTTRTYVT